MKTIIFVTALSFAVASCGNVDEPGEMSTNQVAYTLLKANAGADFDTPCHQNSSVEFTLELKNLSTASKTIAITRIDVVGKWGLMAGTSSSGKIKALELKTEGLPFTNTLAGMTEIKLTGYFPFAYGGADYAEKEGTWHSEIDIEIDGELVTLIGDKQTDYWSHIETLCPSS
jgi:hypothetical protein